VDDGQARRTSARRLEPDAGTMALEMVLMTPVLVIFLLLVVACGRLVAVRGDVEAASRDAARAASLEHSYVAADGVARRTANASLGGRWDCDQLSLAGSDWEAGGTVTVELTCRVPFGDLGLLGLPGTVGVTRDSTAPLDLYRRTTG
jgi:Flp pilus assembly protein TadG